MLRMQGRGALPARLNSGDRIEVRLRALGGLPMGRQAIEISDTCQGQGTSQVRTMHDRGGALTGPLSLARDWHHQISLKQAPGDPKRTLWTDTLRFTSPVAWILGPVLFCTWHLRAIRIKTLARDW